MDDNELEELILSIITDSKQILKELDSKKDGEENSFKKETKHLKKRNRVSIRKLKKTKQIPPIKKTENNIIILFSAKAKVKNEKHKINPSV